MRKTLNSLAGLVIGAILGVTLMWAFAPEPKTVYVEVPSTVVPCPGEDSCTPDYYDGAWHIN